MSTPPQPEVSIGWRNVHLEAGSNTFFHRNTKTTILHHQEGFFTYHSLNYLMGPSGAGKTTLLNCLSGNERGSTFTNNDWQIYLTDTSIVSAFIEQHVSETIFGKLTVGDLLRYAFRFKNGRTRGDSEMTEHIKRTLAELLLEESILERPFELCSGGEQKRVAIAQELMSLTKPALLYIDEPTTGLDSTAAYEVMSSLKDLTTAYRMAVVVSIHLPNSEIINLFDKLFVLAKGGLCIYQGAPGELAGYLEAAKCPIYETEQPIETLLTIACNGVTDTAVLTLARSVPSLESAVDLSTLNPSPFGVPHHPKRFNVYHLYLQCRRLTRITFIANRSAQLALLGSTFFTLFLMTSIFNHDMVIPNGCATLNPATGNASISCLAQLDTDVLLNENINYLSFLLICAYFLISVSSPILFSPLVRIFRSEHRNRWYSISTFFWSSFAISTLQMILLCFLWAIGGYVLSEQQAADDYRLNWLRLGHFLSVTLLMGLYAQAIGQLVSTLLADYLEVAVLACQMVFSFMVMLNDYFIKADQLDNIIFRAISEVVALKYLTRYLLVTFYGFARCVPGAEVSLVLLKHASTEEQIPYYVTRLLINVLVIKLATWVTFYWKFRSYHDDRIVRWLVGVVTGCWPGWWSSTDVRKLRAGSTIVPVWPISPLYEVEPYYLRKILVAWRNLSLVESSSSIFEGQNTNGHQEKDRLILRHLDGEFRFGTVNALMGTSGSGKTTLLKVLNGRYKSHLTEESTFYLSRLEPIQTCFITQNIDGHLLPGLTARQSLVYASRLKNSEAAVDHNKVALKLLDSLDLLEIVDSRVDRCSGGERKRLALALELTTTQMPNLVCIDEPTSGLDSNSAETVITVLGKVARKHNLAIIASVHQPNSAQLRLFDQLYVLARGGVCVYSGPPHGIERHLHQDSVSSSTQPPIEQLLKISCYGSSNETVRQLEAVSRKNQTDPSILHQQTEVAADGVIANRSRFHLHSVLTLSTRYLYYIYGHLWKEWLFFIVFFLSYACSLKLFFDPTIAQDSGCIDPETADLNATACGKTGPEGAATTESDIEKNFKYNFFMNNMFLFMILVHNCLTFGREMAYFRNEQRNGWYSSGAFLLTKSIFEILPMLPLIGVYLAICNIYSEVQPGIFPHLFLVFTLSAIGFQGLAQICSILSAGRTVLLMALSLGTFVLSLFLGNFFVGLPRLHYVYQALARLSIIRYSFEACLLLEYGFGRCRRGEIQLLHYQMGIADADYYFNLTMLVVNLIAVRCIAVLCLVGSVSSGNSRRKRVVAGEEEQIEEGGGQDVENGSLI